MSHTTITHLLVPDINERNFQCKSTDPFLINKNVWIPVRDVSLGGFFYDYIRNSANVVLGVRYWLINETVFDRHQVFKFFLNDSRFLFNHKDSFVDILFDKASVFDFENNLLFIDNAQDFGGEIVIKNEQKYGIAFQRVSVESQEI
ncbi:hypothetical protein H8L32_18635 [Undibacterium sp. CY18W]|uniref:Uncharacterized protein n=1 Tax=Undibacterium hunanense TaxID=2762292 RepID=A0ABR6ZUI5_9BURK|nr:hypothetical protein [Undibacterium hunanense]MBC3919510.1 hypothetical protein [Undibacterium hunanense]